MTTSTHDQTSPIAGGYKASTHTANKA